MITSILNVSLNGNSDIMSIKCKRLYLDINSGDIVPADLDVEVIPQFKTGHKGSWALRASVKRCCSSNKSWTSFLSRLFSCSRHSYTWLQKISVCQKKQHINHMHQWAFFYVFPNICPQLPSYVCMGQIIIQPANLLKSTNAKINILYILYNVQLANLMQLISSLSLSFAAPLCSNSVLFSSFKPFPFIIRALRSQSYGMFVMICCFLIINAQDYLITSEQTTNSKPQNHFGWHRSER